MRGQTGVGSNLKFIGNGIRQWSLLYLTGISSAAWEGLVSTQADGSWPIRIFVLGRFQILSEGQPVRFAFKLPRKPLALLKALVCSRDGQTSQEALCKALWPQLDSHSATRALHTTLFRLRSLLRCHAAVVLGGGVVTLDPERCWVDAWAFERALEDARDVTTLQWGLRYYAGPLLSETVHPLVADARDRLRRKFFRAAVQVGKAYERSTDLGSAIDLYQMALSADDHSEELYCALMRCLIRQGDSIALFNTYERCKMMLSTQFNAVPSAATEQLYQEGREQLGGSLMSAFQDEQHKPTVLEIA